MLGEHITSHHTTPNHTTWDVNETGAAVGLGTAD